MTHAPTTPTRLSLTAGRLISTALLVAGLAACGGGSGDSSSTASGRSLTGT